jgi:exodeoxyribonuclease VII small subunit
MTFEASLRRLDEIVRALEGGETTLEDSMRLFEEGVALARRCSEMLGAAERKIETLVEKGDGGYELKPFAADEAGEEGDIR